MSARIPRARHAHRARQAYMLNCKHQKQWEPRLGGNALDYYWDQWFDSDRSDLSSNLMQVDTLF